MRLLQHELVMQRLDEAQRRAAHRSWAVRATADADLGGREHRRLVRPARSR